MCIMREWKLRFLPLALVVFMAAGCDGSTEPEDVLADFNATEITGVMESFTAPVEASAEANAILGNFFYSVMSGFAFDRESAIARFGDSRIQSFVRTMGFRTQAEIPAQLLGRTFVWNTAETRWVADEARTGAPADGLRVIWYALDDLGEIAMPLAERGYIDVRDVSTTALERLAVEAVRTVGGSLTVADYIYGYGYTDNGVDWTEQVVLEGTFTDGTQSADVAMYLNDAGNWTTGDETYAWMLSFDGLAGSYTWEVEGDWDGTSEADSGTFDVTVNTDGVATVLALEFFATADGSGTLSHGGVVVANVTMANEDFVLSKPGGGSFTTEQNTQLETVISSMIIYGPLLLFSLPFFYF